MSLRFLTNLILNLGDDMRSYSHQFHLLQQDVVKVAVKVEEMTSPDRFDPQGFLLVGLGTIAAYALFQICVMSLVG